MKIGYGKPLVPNINLLYNDRSDENTNQPSSEGKRGSNATEADPGGFPIFTLLTLIGPQYQPINLLT